MTVNEGVRRFQKVDSTEELNVEMKKRTVRRGSRRQPSMRLEAVTKDDSCLANVFMNLFILRDPVIG